MTEDTIYIGDGGDVVTITAQAVQPRQPGHWMDPGPLGTLGVGVPSPWRPNSPIPKGSALLLRRWCLRDDRLRSRNLRAVQAPFIGVIGNNSAMNQIRYGQIAKYGENRGNVGNKLGDVPFSMFAEMLGGYGEEVRDPKDRPALERGRRRPSRACQH